MMTHTALALLIASCVGSVDLTSFVDEIHQNNFQRVAVCPRPIILDGQERTSVDDIALLATEQIQQMTQQLISDGRGSFEVIDPDAVFSAIKGLTLDDLSDMQVRQRIGRQIGAQAMLIVFAEENRDDGQWDLFVKLIHLEDSTVVAAETETMDIILSDAAYMGDSFEVRRWGANGLEAVGFDADMPADWAMGVGPDWERLQYARLNRKQQHPLENPQLPYGIQFVVNGRPMVPERICEKLYVPIDPSPGPQGQGPEIGIRMFNHSGRGVFMAVYIDGVNMINQVRELPITTPTERHWSVRDGYDTVLSHWYHLRPGQPAEKTEFRFVEAEQSVAAGQGLPAGENDLAYGDRIDDRLGMVTCIVYTDGWDGVNANSDAVPTRGPRPRFAFGAGNRAIANINWVQGQRGIMLAAMTLHYRTPQELESIRALGCQQLAGASP